jgi:hypothetical protein
MRGQKNSDLKRKRHFGTNLNISTHTKSKPKKKTPLKKPFKKTLKEMNTLP